MTSKHGWVTGLILTFCAVASADVTPDEMLGAVDKMTPQQAHDFSQKLEAKLWKPVPEGFFSRMGVDIGFSGYGLADSGLSDMTFSGDDVDLESAAGMDVGLFWRVLDPRFRVGLRIGSLAATDSDLGPNGYSRVDLLGSTVTLGANIQWVRKARWLVWTELGPGAGSVEIETVDTPAGLTTTERHFDGSYALLDLQTGVSWRLNSIVTLFGAGGYRFAESVNLDEGGDETDMEFDGSGGFGRFGLGVNF